MVLSFQQKDSLFTIIESVRILSLDGNVHGNIQDHQSRISGVQSTIRIV